MIKHTYFSIELSILKHPVITVINKRRKEPNYGQELAFQSKQITTTETSWTDRQARWIKSKNHDILRHTGAQQVTTKTSSRNSHFSTRIQGIGTNYTSLSYITTTKPDAIDPTTGEASSIPSRKENNCYIPIVGINSNIPQVAPRTTREDPTSTAISLTQFFFLSFQCRVPGTCFPRKGRSEGDASEK